MHEELTPEEQKVARAIRREDETTGWVVVGALALVALGGAILAWQCYHWLRVAEWPSLSWADGFWWAFEHPLDLPRARGAEKILRWFGGLPLFTLPIAVAVIGAWAWFRDDDGDPERRRVRGKIARNKLHDAAESGS